MVATFGSVSDRDIREDVLFAEKKKTGLLMYFAALRGVLLAR